MARKTRSEILAAIHETAMSEFDAIQLGVSNERELCLKDRRFYSIPGAQWEGDFGDQFINKPKIEVNKVHLSVIRIINEYRNNRITVDFVSRDGTENENFADVCDGLFRADEQDSVAEEAYDNAFEEAVAGGMGAWRLTTKYEDEEDEENEHQRIYIEPIFDADSTVFFDLQAKRQDKSDAKRCFVLTSMTKEAYRDEWDDEPESWPNPITQSQFDWSNGDLVFVAEYYREEKESKIVVTYEGIDGSEEQFDLDNLDDETLEMLNAVGSKETRRRKISKKKIHKYILSGGGILEDCGLLAGNCIPIIPVYGKRWYVDNVERCMGHVRLATDVQRLKNVQLSKLGELSALSSTEKPIFTPEQIVGHETMWAEDNINNYPYMLVNPVETDQGEVASGPVGYTKPPQIPQALAALLEITEKDMSDLLGNQQSGEQVVSNIAQGTMELIQNRLDMQTYIYMSNMRKSMRRCGQIWLGMAKDIFVEKERKMKYVDKEGKSSQITLLQPKISDDGSTIVDNDFSRVKFDVVAEVGPSSSTKKAATVRALTGAAAISDDPETKQVLSAMIMMNIEGEGLGDARKYFRRKLLKIGAVEPTEAEEAEMKEEAADTPPSAQDTYLTAAAENERAKGAKAQADTLLSQAKTDLTRVEAVEKIVDIDSKKQDQAMNVIEKFGPRVVPPDIEGSPVR